MPPTDINTHRAKRDKTISFKRDFTPFPLQKRLNFVCERWRGVLGNVLGSGDKVTNGGGGPVFQVAARHPFTGGRLDEKRGRIV